MVAALAVAAAVLGAGCSVPRVNDGIFRSAKGYRVAIPGADWSVVESSQADLELRHRGGAAGMLANAQCGGAIARRPPEILERHLLAGLRGRKVVERGEALLDGRPAMRAVLEGAADDRQEPLMIETYVMKNGPCVYDLVYAAAPARFAEGRGDFARFVESFALQDAGERTR
jgi:hypothetical protein